MVHPVQWMFFCSIIIWSLSYVSGEFWVEWGHCCWTLGFQKDRWNVWSPSMCSLSSSNTGVRCLALIHATHKSVHEDISGLSSAMYVLVEVESTLRGGDEIIFANIDLHHINREMAWVVDILPLACSIPWLLMNEPGFQWLLYWHAQIARFMRPTLSPPGTCRPQMGPMLDPWTLLSGWLN